MTTDLLIYIILFTVYLFPQAMIINGIWLSAQGSTEIKPDGTEHDSEMIFYKLAKYLNQKNMVKVYYAGKLLDELGVRINNTFPTLTTLTPDTTELHYWKKQKEQIEKTFDIKIYISTADTISLYREYSEYKFSKYLRKPLFGCVICMSSFWGLLIFLIPAFFAFHRDPIILALYVPNTFALAYLNYKIMKPL